MFFFLIFNFMVSFFTLEGDHFAGANSCIAGTWGEDTGGR